MAALRNELTARDGRTRRKPKSARRPVPRPTVTYRAAATNETSKTKSRARLTAGEGCERLDPPAPATAPTITLPRIHTPKPTSTTTGSVHRGHGGTSGCGRSGSRPAASGSGQGAAGGGGG